jgi:hypothetical protein
MTIRAAVPNKQWINIAPVTFNCKEVECSQLQSRAISFSLIKWRFKSKDDDAQAHQHVNKLRLTSIEFPLAQVFIFSRSLTRLDSRRVYWAVEERRRNRSVLRKWRRNLTHTRVLISKTCEEEKLSCSRKNFISFRLLEPSWNVSSVCLTTFPVLFMTIPVRSCR